MAGLFVGLYDFNHDGKMDGFERAAEIGAIMNMMDDSRQDEIEEAGLDRSELEMMDDEERREALEDAGLDPDDFY